MLVPSHTHTHTHTHRFSHSLTVTHSLTHCNTCSLTQMCMCASYAASTVWSKHWCMKVTDKIVPVHTLMEYWGLELIVPLTPNLGTRWRWAVSFMPWWLNPEEKHLWYSLNMGCVDHQVGWDVWEKRRSFYCVENWTVICHLSSFVSVPTVFSCYWC